MDSEDLSFSKEEEEEIIEERPKKRLQKHKHEKRRRNEQQLKLFDDEVDEDSGTEESLNEFEKQHLQERRRKEQIDRIGSIKQRVAPDFLRKDMTEDEIRARYEQADYEEDENDEENEYYEEQGQLQYLIPGKKDPKIFSVEILKRGKEQELAFQLLNKYKHIKNKDSNFKIISVSAFDSQEGMIFIEAYRKIDVSIGIRGIDGIKGSTLQVIKETDIPKVFTVKQQEEYDVKENQFVKIKAGISMPYSMDIGQVIGIDSENRCEVEVILRRDEEYERRRTEYKSRYRMGGDDDKEGLVQPRYTMENRPEQDPDNQIKKLKVHARNLITDIDLAAHKMDMMRLKNMTDFELFFEDHKDHLKLSSSNKNLFKAGDKVKVIKGDFTGLKCRLKHINGKQATINPLLKGLEDEEWEVYLEDVSKYFRPNQHVQVVSGRHLGKTGEIVSINVNGEAKITTDNLNQITVHCNNLIVSEARNVQTVQSLSDLKRLDLIKMTGFNGVGIVLRIAADYITVLNSHNKVQNINKMEYDSKIDTRNITFKTHLHDIIQSGSVVTIKDGYYKGTKAQVKHIHKDLCFLFSKDFNNSTDNIIVERANSLQVQSRVVRQQRAQPVFSDRQKNEHRQLLNEDENQQQQQGQQNNRNNSFNNNKNETMVGSSLKIKAGMYKGLFGIIKRVNGDQILIEIPAKMKTVMIKMSDIQQPQSSTQVGQTPSYNPQSVHHTAQSPSYGAMQSPGYSNANSFQSPYYRGNNF